MAHPDARLRIKREAAIVLTSHLVPRIAPTVTLDLDAQPGML